MQNSFISVSVGDIIISSNSVKHSIDISGLYKCINCKNIKFIVKSKHSLIRDSYYFVDAICYLCNRFVALRYDNTNSGPFKILKTILI